MSKIKFSKDSKALDVRNLPGMKFKDTMTGHVFQVWYIHMGELCRPREDRTTVHMIPENGKSKVIGLEELKKHVSGGQFEAQPPG